MNKYINRFKEFYKNSKEKYLMFKAFFKEAYNKKIMYIYLIDSFVLAWFIEIIARHSLVDGFIFLISSPYVLLCNMVIILMTLSFTLLIRKRFFWMALISVVWLGLGIANSVLLSFRVTPLTAVDLLLIDNAIKIADKYLNLFAIILLIIAIVAAVVGLIYVWLKFPKVDHKIKLLRNAIVIGIVYGAGMLVIALGLSSGLVESKFRNLRESYYKNGFVYCFTTSLLNTGVDKPDGYSKEKVEELKNNEEIKKVEDKPNIVFLQLESFFDVNHMINFTYSENPLPYFTELKEKYPSGFFNVPIVGAGTVNTEFETMTGMNLDDFGPGEYPFKMVLTETPCESICYNLKNYKYACHALHNNTATFYGRNTVFSNLGYDTFTSIENMHIDEMTEVGWAKDKYLTEYILKCMDSTPKKKDFVYAISVQGHGSYPSDEVDNKIKIVSGLEDDGERRYSFEYYIKQINEMDNFLRELTEALTSRNEKTILVLYGDHLPSLGISAEELDNGNVYQTEYVIWSNYEVDYESEDIEAYQLQAKILEKLKMTAGDVNFYSQQHRHDEDQETYLEGLKTLEYDILYGEQLVYDGVSPYEPTDLKLGLYEVKLASISPRNDAEGTIYLYGDNFTKYSTVYINEEEYESVYIDPQTIVVLYPELQEGDAFSIYQQDTDGNVLTMTEPLIFENENLGIVEEQTTEEETTKKKKKKKNDSNISKENVTEEVTNE